MAAFKLEEAVEIVVGGAKSDDWQFDGCRGTVRNVFSDRGKMFATVHIETKPREGRHVFAVECLKRLEDT